MMTRGLNGAEIQAIAKARGKVEKLCDVDGLNLCDTKLIKLRCELSKLSMDEMHEVFDYISNRADLESVLINAIEYKVRFAMFETLMYCSMGDYSWMITYKRKHAPEIVARCMLLAMDAVQSENWEEAINKWCKGVMHIKEDLKDKTCDT